jgi:phosphoadenosine phosphosulfate reductase
MEIEYLQKLNNKVANKSLAETFDVLINLNLGKLAFSTSFGQEDQVITDFIFKNDFPISVFTLDTGRLFEETYEVYHKTLNRYKRPITPFFPNDKKVEELLEVKGPFSFYDSVENRKECCSIRKVDPLQRALKGVDVWVTGLRGSQSNYREQLNIFEFDSSFGLIKFNPLINWSLEEVIRYLNENRVPQNSLHSKGYASIGCAPCTRAIGKGDDIRSGRWWWENSKKECGLHQNQNIKS